MSGMGDLAQMARGLLRSETSPEEARSAVRRLLAIAPEESGKSSPAVPSGSPEPPENAYERVFDGVLARVEREASELDRERSAAAGLWAELQEQKREGWRLRVRNDRRFHTWAFGEHLLDESRDTGRGGDPERALAIADLALEAVHHLDAGRFGEERVADLQALAWLAVEEARRLQRDLEGARAALDCATEVLARGTGDPLARALLAGHEAALAVDLQEYAEAAEHLDRAIRLHRRFGDVDYAGERLVQEALRRHDAEERATRRQRHTG